MKEKTIKLAGPEVEWMCSWSTIAVHSGCVRVCKDGCFFGRYPENSLDSFASGLHQTILEIWHTNRPLADNEHRYGEVIWEMSAENGGVAKEVWPHSRDWCKPFKLRDGLFAAVQAYCAKHAPVDPDAELIASVTETVNRLWSHPAFATQVIALVREHDAKKRPELSQGAITDASAEYFEQFTPTELADEDPFIFFEAGMRAGSAFAPKLPTRGEMMEKLYQLYYRNSRVVDDYHNFITWLYEQLGVTE